VSPPPSIAGTSSRRNGSAKASTSPARAATSPPVTADTVPRAAEVRVRPAAHQPTAPASVANHSSEPAMPPHRAASRYGALAPRRLKSATYTSE
jgi:hypothetical protein